ncbi:MAG: hypothetical protein NW226_23260 [Microscillaceae bacterium]|nr:hypothetical protein [Microscillaceae bacterium]
MSENQESGGFWSIKKLLFTEEFLDQNTQKPNKTENKEEDIFKKNTIPSNKTSQNPEIEKKPVANTSLVAENKAQNADSSELMEKIYAAIKKMNLPGIDFLEVWDSMEAMGGINETNLRNSFLALKIASGNTLTKEIILQTGRKYLEDISTQLNSDIQSKEAEKNLLENELKTKKAELEQKKSTLQEQLKNLQLELQQIENNLGNIEESYAPKFSSIHSKINAGLSAQQNISNEITSIIQLIEKTL